MISQITTSGMVLAGSSCVSIHKGIAFVVVLSMVACTQPYPEAFRGASRPRAVDDGGVKMDLPQPIEEPAPLEPADSGAYEPPAFDGGAGVDVCSCTGPGIPFPECPPERPKGCPGS